MLQKWVDHTGQEVRVKDKYDANKLLIDLTLIPKDIQQAVIESIVEGTTRDPIPQVGIHFLKFCAKWDLQKLAQWPDDFAKMLNAKYEQSGV